jgi:hypothetical protein
MRKLAFYLYSKNGVPIDFRVVGFSGVHSYKKGSFLLDLYVCKETGACKN